MPAHFIQPSIPPRLFPELGIGKRQLHVCPAWQLRENDPELCVISPDDDPVIPEGIGEPPVLRAIQERKNRQARKS
jgi:hypothetical protein